MITYNQIEKLFSYDLKMKSCIEIEFELVGNPDYQDCWMGKMPDNIQKDKECYWFGLAVDGSKAYDYDNFYDFSSAPVFDGKNLKEIWNQIEVLSIN